MKIYTKLTQATLISIFLIVFFNFIYYSDFISNLLNILINSPFILESIIIFTFLLCIGLLIKTRLQIFIKSIYRESVIIIILYSYYRFVSGLPLIKLKYQFNYENWELYLIDILFTLFFLTFLIKLFLTNINKNTNEIREHEGFIYEKPVRRKENDDLERSPFVSKLIHKIENTDLSTGSFGVGIIGKWGSGKTSFMSLMKEEIEKKSHSSIIIDFNPWHNQNYKNINEAFFDLLSIKLSERTIFVRKLINNYLRKLSASKNIFELFVANDAIDIIYEEIQETLKTLNKNIYIFIDDIDRLDKQEVLAVFKLIRNTANFRNTIFIVGYDIDYLTSEVRISNTNEYIKKIFNIQIPLPFINEDSLNKHINLHSSKKNFEFENIKNLLGNEEDVLGKELKNIRDLNIISNSFALLREIIGEEVSKKDLITLEILRLNYPSLYEALIKNKDKIIYEDNGIYKLNQTFEEPFKKFQENKLLEILFSPFRESKSGVPTMNMDDTLSIRDVKYFERFFILRLLENEISELDFEKIMELEFPEIQKSLDFWIKNKKEDLLAKILNRKKESFQSKKTFKNYLESSFYIICWNWSKTDLVNEQKQVIAYIIRLALYDKENLYRSHHYYEKIDEDEFKSDVNELYIEYYPKMNTKVRIHFQFALIEFIRSISVSQNIGFGLQVKSVLEGIMDVTNYSDGSEVNSQLSLLRDLSQVISVIEKFEENSHQIINDLKPKLRANIEKIPIDKLYELIKKSNHLHYEWLIFFSFYFEVDKASIQSHLDEKSGAFTERAISNIIKSSNKL